MEDVPKSQGDVLGANARSAPTVRAAVTIALQQWTKPCHRQPFYDRPLKPLNSVIPTEASFRAKPRNPCISPVAPPIPSEFKNQRPGRLIMSWATTFYEVSFRAKSRNPRISHRSHPHILRLCQKLVILSGAQRSRRACPERSRTGPAFRPRCLEPLSEPKPAKNPCSPPLKNRISHLETVFKTPGARQ